VNLFFRLNIYIFIEIKQKSLHIFCLVLIFKMDHYAKQQVFRRSITELICAVLLDLIFVENVNLSWFIKHTICMVSTLRYFDLVPKYVVVERITAVRCQDLHIISSARLGLVFRARSFGPEKIVFHVTSTSCRNQLYVKSTYNRIHNHR
jgi:hypothetical protein